MPRGALSGSVNKNNAQQTPPTPTPSLPQSYVPPPPPDPNVRRLPQSESIGIWVKCALDGQKINTALQYYLNSIEAYLMPLRNNRDGLIEIYCNTVHPLLPILDKDQFLKLHSIGQAPTLLLHAVLLVAARYPEAKPYLGSQSVRDFCAITAEKVRALLYSDVEQDRMTLLRVYALLSLHAEGPDGLENSCSDLQKAIHYAVSLGLHHNRDKPTDFENNPEAHEQLQLHNEFRNIWWSLWCLDRISACVNARPLITNLEDVSVKYTTPEQHPVLASLIDSCKTLERVIYLYRPNPVLQRGSAASVFASIFGSNIHNGMFEPDISTPITAVLSLIKYTAIILAHKRRTDESRIEDRSPPGHIFKSSKPSSPLEKTRRQEVSIEPGNSDTANKVLLEATRHILYIVESCQDILPPLPLIPYCVSLTLTIFLRTYPQVDTSDAYSSPSVTNFKVYTWKDSADLLKRLSDRWWVAAAMGKMGLTVFKKLEEENPKQHNRSDSNSHINSSNTNMNINNNINDGNNNLGPNQQQSHQQQQQHFSDQSNLQHRSNKPFSSISSSPISLPSHQNGAMLTPASHSSFTPPPQSHYNRNSHMDNNSNGNNGNSNNNNINSNKCSEHHDNIPNHQFKNLFSNIDGQQIERSDAVDKNMMVDEFLSDPVFNFGAGNEKGERANNNGNNTNNIIKSNNSNNNNNNTNSSINNQNDSNDNNNINNNGNGNGNNGTNDRDQILDMFSQLPNPTSFLDTMLRSTDIDFFDDMKTWDGWDV